MEALPRILGNGFLLKHFPKSVKRFSGLKCATKNLFSEKCGAVFGIKNAPLKTYFPKSVKRFSDSKMRH